LSALKAAFKPWSGLVSWTAWGNGKYELITGTKTNPGVGKHWKVTIPEYVDGLQDYARLVVPKGEGLVIAHGASEFGGSSDAECVEVTWFFLDADCVGDWDPVKAVLDTSDASYVLSRSSSHDPAEGKIKWHLEIPLVVSYPIDQKDVFTSKERYCARFGWTLGVFASIGKLTGVDASTDRLLQPMFASCKRTADSAIPEFLYRDGLGFDWDQFLKATSFVAPEVTPRKKVTHATVVSTVGGTAGLSLLAEAFAMEGLFVGKGKNGKAIVLCPQGSEHTGVTDGTSSTVILPSGVMGVFKCSHAHCKHLQSADVIKRLSADTQAWISEQMSKPGVEKVKRQLDAQAHPLEPDVTLAEVEQVVGKAIEDFEGGLCVVQVPTGAGKTRAEQHWLAKRKKGWVAVPTHVLAEEVLAALKALGAAAKLHQGVTRALEKLDCCPFKTTVVQVQAMGGSVPKLCCSDCPKSRDCPARKPVGDGEIHVLPHALLGGVKLEERDENAGESDPGDFALIDESPQLWKEETLDAITLGSASGVLSVKNDLTDPMDAKGLWLVTQVALAMDGGKVKIEDAAKKVIDTADGKAALEAVEGASIYLRWKSEVAVDGLAGRVRRAARDLGDHFAEELVKPKGLVSAKADKVGEVLQYLKAVKVGLVVAKALGEPSQRWRSEKLVVHVDTSEARFIRRNGGVLLDATPDMAELKRLRDGVVDIKRVFVADSVPFTRTVVFRSHSSRRSLLPKGNPNWEEVMPIVRDALERAANAGVKKLLVITYLKLADGLNKGGTPCDPLLAEWRKDKTLEVNHYGGVRGRNVWKDFDGCVTVGDPWCPVTSYEERAGILGIPALLHQRETAARELAQAHGRLRAPSRKEPAWAWHYGQVAPMDWDTFNAKVEQMPAHRPKAKAAMTPEDFTALVDSKGGANAIAKALGVHRRTVERYMSGHRTVTQDVIDKLTGV
jgi:hypothetical protein